MNFAKGISKFLGWLGRARFQSPQPPSLPPRPSQSIFTGYDPNESVVIDVIDDRAAEEFLYFGVRVATPQSSNVAAFWYDPEAFKLFVEFKNTYVYEYEGINVELAYDFFTAFSKGRWVWDNLRTVRRAYQFLYSLNGRVPTRMEDPAGTSVAAARGSLSILGRDPFAYTKSAVRVKIKYQIVAAAKAKRLPFSFQKQHSYQFIHARRQKLGLKKIRQIIRGRP